MKEIIIAQKEIIQKYNSYDWFNDFPWWVGFVGDIYSNIWFLGENPSKTQLEKESRKGNCTTNSQWNISPGDELLRKAISEADLKTGDPFTDGGWKCYITNAIKTPEKVKKRNENKKDPNYWKTQALIWLSVLQLQIDLGKPEVIVLLGGETEKIFKFMCDNGLKAPEQRKIHHYSYIMSRPEAGTNRVPRDPERIAEFKLSVKEIAEKFA